MKKPELAIEALKDAFGGLSNIPNNVYIQSAVGLLNNSFNAIFNNAEYHITTYATEYYHAVNQEMLSREWDFGIILEDFVNQVKEGFYTLHPSLKPTK